MSIDQAPTTREALVRDQAMHPPVGSRRQGTALPAVRCGVSGSGANLLILIYTAADLARERAAGARLLGAMGVRPKMRVANALAGALVTPGSLLLGDVVEELGCLDVPLGFPDSKAVAEQAWRLLDRVQPQVLVIDVAGAAVLLAHAPTAERAWLEGMIWLRRADVEDSAIAIPDVVGFQGWQRDWFAVPEATSFVAASCANSALHFDAEILAEVQLADGTIAVQGRGNLLLTPFGMDTPVLRYDAGCVVELSSTPCACGDVSVSCRLAS